MNNSKQKTLIKNIKEYNRNLAKAKKSMEKLMKGGYMEYMYGGDTKYGYGGNAAAGIFGMSHNNQAMTNPYSPANAGYIGKLSQGHIMQMGGMLGSSLPKAKSNDKGMSYSMPTYQMGGEAPMPNSDQVAAQMIETEGGQPMQQQQPQMDEEQMMALQELAMAAMQGDEEALAQIQQLPEELQMQVLQMIEQMEQEQGGMEDGMPQQGMQQDPAMMEEQMGEQGMPMMYGGGMLQVPKAKKKKKKGGKVKSSSKSRIDSIYSRLGIK